jgi:excisionase family DNA binding protein
MQKRRKRWAEPRGKPAGYVTVRRAIALAQCSEPTIRRLIRRRGVQVVRWRHRVLLKEADVRAWLKAKPYQPAKQGPLYPRQKPHAAESGAESNTAGVGT